MNINNIVNISLIFVSVTLIIYHLIIYFGRQDKVKIYYLYYIIFTFFLILWIIFSTDLCYLIYKTIYVKQFFSPFIQIVIISLLLNYFYKLLIFIIHLKNNYLNFKIVFKISCFLNGDGFRNRYGYLKKG